MGNTPIHTNTASRLDGSRRANQNRNTSNRSRNNDSGFTTRYLDRITVENNQANGGFYNSGNAASVPGHWRGRGRGGASRGGRGGGTPGRNNRGNTIAKRNSNVASNNQTQLAKKRLLQAKKTL